MNVTVPLVPLGVVTDTVRGPGCAVGAVATVNVALALVALDAVMPVTVIPTPLTLTVKLPLLKFVPVKATDTLVPCPLCVGLMSVSVGPSMLNVTVPLVPLGVVTDSVTDAPGDSPIVSVQLAEVALDTLTPLAETPLPLTLTVNDPLLKFVPVSVTDTDDEVPP